MILEVTDEDWGAACWVAFAKDSQYSWWMEVRWIPGHCRGFAGQAEVGLWGVLNRLVEETHFENEGRVQWAEALMSIRIRWIHRELTGPL